MKKNTSEKTSRDQPTGAQLELRLIEILKKVLGANQITREDNFFDLGGDSIKSLSFAVELSKSGFSKDALPLENLIDKNIAELADILKEKSKTEQNFSIKLDRIFRRKREQNY